MGGELGPGEDARGALHIRTTPGEDARGAAASGGMGGELGPGEDARGARTRGRTGGEAASSRDTPGTFTHCSLFMSKAPNDHRWGCGEGIPRRCLAGQGGLEEGRASVAGASDVWPLDGTESGDWARGRPR